MCRVPSGTSRTVVTLAICGPTARRQASVTFSSHMGPLRMTSARTAGITLFA